MWYIFALLFYFFIVPISAQNEDLLQEALELADFITVEKLIKQDKSLLLGTIQQYQCSFMHYALELLHEQKNIAYQEKLKHIILFLIKEGADLKTPLLEHQTTCLHESIRYGFNEITLAMLTKKINLNALDYKNRTPLHYAVLTNNAIITEKLCEMGASKTLQDSMFYTPIDRAREVKNYKIIETVLKPHSFEEALQQLDLDAAIFYKQNPMQNKYNYILYVLNQFNIRYMYNLQKRCQKVVVETLIDAESLEKILKFLLKHIKTVNDTDFTGETPLHKATRLGLKNIVQLLLRHGALPNMLTRNNETALDVALYFNHPELIAPLYSAGGRWNKKQIIPMCPQPGVSIHELRKQLNPALNIKHTCTTLLQKQIIFSFLTPI